MDRLLAECPEAVAAAEHDLLAGVENPETGRQGMTAEQVLRAYLVKKQNRFSYGELEFHLADSQTYRAFCRFGAFEKTPSGSALQANISRLRPETMELLNQCLLRIGRQEKVETGGKVRVDTTAVEANVHPPTDSSLLWDCTRSLVRLLGQAKPYGVAFRDRSRAVKTRAYRIAYMRGKDRRKPVYRQLRHFRAGVEGVIGYLKHAFGLRRIMRRGYTAFKADVWASVVSANLLTLARHRLAAT